MRIVPLTLSAALVASAGLAQGEWLPPPVAEGAAQQLARRLTELEIGSSDPEEQLETARSGVRDMVLRIDGWGIDGVLARAPDLAEVEFPPTEDGLMAAIASFGACSLPLHVELVETKEEKAFVAIGEVAVGVLSAFLMDEFLRRGGTHGKLEAYLNSEAMNRLSYDIQVRAETRTYVAAQCAPMFEALFE